MQDPIIIEQMKLSEKDQVLAFLRSAYSDNPRHSDPAFWDWHFPGSPYCDANDLPVWLAKSGGRIVGQLAGTPVEFNAAGETVRAIWILDLIIDLDFRRRGIAKRLALASLGFCPFVLGINTSAQHSTELLESLGWVIFTRVPRFQRVLFPGDAVREIARVKPLRSAVNFAFKPFRPNAKALAVKEGEVKTLEEFDPSFDDLWREARPQWGCSVSRNRAMLDWQFRRQPGKQFDILGYFKEGRLLGYAVLFFRKADESGSIPKAAISDICYHPDKAAETLDALIKGSLNLATRRRAGTLVTDVLDRRLEQRLREFGFRRVRSNVQLLANVPRHQEAVYDPGKWFLTRGDSDLSIFEDANI